MFYRINTQPFLNESVTPYTFYKQMVAVLTAVHELYFR